jgi:hypothetical protein
MKFDVFDIRTDKYPDLRDIALNEQWASGLMYFDMEGFYISEDGILCICDECGNYRYCPHGRFKIVLELPELSQAHSFIY